MSDSVEAVEIVGPTTATGAEKHSNMVRDAIATVDVSKYNLNIFDEVYDRLRATIVNKQFNAGNWIILLTMAMEMVETVPHLTGKDKRALVVDLITKLVSEIPMSDNDRLIIQGILSSSMPAIIDAICDSALGVYAINLMEDAQEHVDGCLKKCLGARAEPRGAKGVKGAKASKRGTRRRR